ncbi:zinc-binding dehydrogenase [Rhodococcus globerulus]|uniref:zinc-binding dehydrogenase n=1 Tax=Rhodococcus globerulus TaxID=33008 RepID=UPI001C56DD13|nr:zinc-binding dehydrogenase [Rhodococcus globerulus]QXW01329.1 zinc-binding dehydrogenase [Rhodococcus globerulus]
MELTVPTSRTALAAVVPDFGQKLEVREVRVPRPEPGALVVAVEVSTVCGSDVHMWKGSMSATIPAAPPIILGHEIVGRVVEIGAGADVDSVGRPVKVGDRVIWEPGPCGRCLMCSVENETSLCTNRQVGMLQSLDVFPYSAAGFTQYSYVWPTAGRLLVPEALSSELASAASCAARTAVEALTKVGQIDYSSRVVIQGSGPLGLFAVAMAAEHRPSKLVVVGGPADRLELARAWGATDVVSVEQIPDRAERLQAVRELTNGGPDVIMEMSGAPGVFSEGIDMAAKNARYVVVGSLGGVPQEVVASQIVTKGMQVTGSYAAKIGSYHKGMEFLAARSSEYRWDDMFTGNSYSLETATDALEALLQQTEIKPVVRPWATS